MKRVYIYLTLGLLSIMAMISCQDELSDNFHNDELKSESESVVILRKSLDRRANTISLSIDALAKDRFNVWIDLDGDESRAEDGSEDVKIFNAYHEYEIKNGLHDIVIHGDITYIGAASNELIDVNITGNPYLTTLNIPQNRLTNLDVSQNRALARLDCSGNNLSSIDVSQNIELISLWVFDNKISSIDVSQNTNLSFLDCSGNSLSSLDISNNDRLEHLLAHNNKIRELDVSGNAQLTRLWLFGNPLSESGLQQLVTSLRSVSGGQLWLSVDPLRKVVTSDASAKGWIVD